MRAAADGLAIWRERSDPSSDSAGAGGDDTLERAAGLLFRTLEQNPQPWLDLLAEALRGEIERWEARSVADPAARRVRDLFASLLEVLEGESADERPRPSAPRKRPPRSASR